MTSCTSYVFVLALMSSSTVCSENMWVTDFYLWFHWTIYLMCNTNHISRLPTVYHNWGYETEEWLYAFWTRQIIDQIMIDISRKGNQWLVQKVLWSPLVIIRIHGTVDYQHFMWMKDLDNNCWKITIVGISATLIQSNSHMLQYDMPQGLRLVWRLFFFTMHEASVEHEVPIGCIVHTYLSVL